MIGIVLAQAASPGASHVQLWGAGCFGAVVGWFLYFVNRYRTGEVQIGDLVTVLGAVGGSAVLALFDAKSDLFGAYGIGLAVGFFGYFLILVRLVTLSVKKQGAFDWDWFLDGRRKNPGSDSGFGSDRSGRGMGTGNQAFGSGPGEPGGGIR
jgi:hypothetical protein